MVSRGTEPEHPSVSEPFSLELLADLHAGVLPSSISDELWPRVRRDPEAVRVLGALDAVRARLATSGREPARGESIPPAVAERIDRALADAEFPISAEFDVRTNGPQPLPATEDKKPRPTVLVPRHRIPRFVAAIGVAAAVVIALGITSAVMIARSSDSDTSSPATASGPESEAPALVVDSNHIDDALVYDVMTQRGGEDLIDSKALPDCLEANGFDRTVTVLGSAAVELDGRSGVMLVIPRRDVDTGLTLLAVDARCSLGNPGTLVRRDID